MPDLLTEREDAVVSLVTRAAGGMLLETRAQARRRRNGNAALHPQRGRFHGPRARAHRER
jgi:hypothetical protein